MSPAWAADGRPLLAEGLFGRWTVHVAFVDGAIEAYRVNEVVSEGRVVRADHEPIACWVEGDVSLGADRAIFRGGRIACAFPSFQRAYNRLRPRGTPAMRRYAEVQPEAVDEWAFVHLAELRSRSAVHPILHHPAYGLRYDVHAGSTWRGRLRVAGWGHSGPSFTRPEASIWMGARVHRCDGPSLSCVVRHTVEDVPLFDAAVPGVPSWRIDNGASVFYIGGAVGAVSGMEGEVHELYFDPGVFVRTG